MADLAQSRHLGDTFPGPRAQALADRRDASVPRGVSAVMPTFAHRAGGGIVEDVDGNRLIDFGSGIAVTTVGASEPRVAEAVRAQVEEFTHSCFMVTPYEHYLEVAERLAELVPVPGPAKTALFNSGAEAVENAVKVARAYTGRQAVAAFDHAYHGRTTLTMGLTAKTMPYKHSFGPFASELYRVPGSYPLHDGLDGAQAAARTIDQLEKQVGAQSLAAVVMEPIQGEGGFIVPAPGFLSEIVRWCRSNGVLFIADEVQTGFARTGDWFASEHEGIEPDIVATAKGIAGGLPLSAVTGRAEVMDAPHVGGLGGTYGGNPIACAAALAVLDTIVEDDLLERAAQVEKIATDHLSHVREQDPRIAEVRGRGAMLAIELVDPATGEPDAALTARVAQQAREAGVITLTCGTWGNVIRLLPPLSISDELLREGLEVLTDALRRS